MFYLRLCLELSLWKYHPKVHISSNKSKEKIQSFPFSWYSVSNLNIWLAIIAHPGASLYCSTNDVVKPPFPKYFICKIISRKGLGTPFIYYTHQTIAGSTSHNPPFVSAFNQPNWFGQISFYSKTHTYIYICLFCCCMYSLAEELRMRSSAKKTKLRKKSLACLYSV